VFTFKHLCGSLAGTPREYMLQTFLLLCHRIQHCWKERAWTTGRY